jgi:DNA-binding MarR family transcriptional regulator
MTRISPAPQRFERRVEGIDYGVLDELVGYALRRAQIAIYEDFESALGPLEMTPQRFSAMVVIAGNDGVTQGTLGRVLGIARSGVVQVVNGLQTRGWVTREAHGSDARSWRLILTSDGKAQLRAARRRVRAHDARIGQRLDATERETLIGLLGRLGPAG